MKEYNTKQGWVVIHRRIIDWEWYDDANTFRLFLHLILRANHEDRKWRGILVEKGSFITSLSKLSEELKLSVKQIRVSLTKLKRTGEVASKTNNKYSYITVKNYSQYQDNGKQEGKQRASKKANEGQAEGKQRATNNNNNNENNEEPRKKIDKKSIHPSEDITDKDLDEIATKYDVPLAFVKSKFDDVINWYEEKPNDKTRKGRVWRKTLMNWVKKDAIKIREEVNKNATRNRMVKAY